MQFGIFECVKTSMFPYCLKFSYLSCRFALPVLFRTGSDRFDSYGLTQVVVPEEKKEMYEIAKKAGIFSRLHSFFSLSLTTLSVPKVVSGSFV